MVKVGILTLAISVLGMSQAFSQKSCGTSHGDDYDGDFTSSTSPDHCISSTIQLRLPPTNSRSLAFNASPRKASSAAAKIVDVSWSPLKKEDVVRRTPNSAVREQLASQAPSVLYREGAAADLLNRSYDLNEQLSDSEQLYYLTELTRASVGIAAPDKTEEWCRRLFRVASEVRSLQIRAAGEKNALIPLASIKPAMAMQLLFEVEFSRASPGELLLEDVRSDAAEAIFSHFWNHFQVNGLPEIENAARYLGATGQYPYHAMANIIEELAKAQSPEMRVKANGIFAEALGFYSHETGFSNRDEEFLHLLRSEGLAIVDADLVVQALRLFTDRLIEQGTMGQASYYAEIHTSDGAAIPFTERNRAFLFLVEPVIHRFDAKFARELTWKYPELQDATGNMYYVSGGFVFGNSTSNDATQQHIKWLQESLLSQIKSLRDSNPKEATALAHRLRAVSVRIAGRSAVLQDVSQSEGWKARSIYAEEISKLHNADVNDPANRLEAIVAAAESAYRVGDLNEFASYSDQAVDLGISFLTENGRSVSLRVQRLEGYERLADIIEFGTAHGLDFLVDRIRQAPNSRLKTYLLIRAAEGVAKRRSSPTF
jgi:hypothetical protein